MSRSVAALAQQIVSLGLVADAQLRECQDEQGALGASTDDLLRVLERKGYLTPFQIQKLKKGDQDGYFLGAYRLLYQISAGSFGRVYRADDPRTGRVVAIKALRRRWSNDPHAIELFEREARLGMTLRHPNIVAILALDKDTGSKTYYIVMEFVEGGSLRDFLTIRKKLAAAEALALMHDATAGLAHAFSRGVTHRDMKLTNILISAQRVAKLVDFGLAGLGAFGNDEERVDRSVDYAGLEKATNVKPGDVRSDIYFLGAVFYEMLTGRAPLLQTKDKNARMQRERFENVLPIGGDELDAPPAVFQLVERMMSLRPEQRYQTPVQLLEAVKQVQREVEEIEHASAEEESGSPEVFLVESSKRLQEGINTSLSQLGYTVAMARTPNAALMRFEQRPYHVLVMDVGAIGVTGVDVFKQVRALADKLGRPLPAILMFSENQDELRKQVEEDERTAILVRPLTIRHLLDKLHALAPIGGAQP
ncbi:MAG: protein kinase [Gemmataceae bacterium]